MIIEYTTVCDFEVVNGSFGGYLVTGPYPRDEKLVCVLARESAWQIPPLGHQHDPVSDRRIYRANIRVNGL